MVVLIGKIPDLHIVFYHVGNRINFIFKNEYLYSSASILHIEFIKFKNIVKMFDPLQFGIRY